MAFLSLNASEFVEMFVGVGASRVRDLFSQARPPWLAIWRGVVLRMPAVGSLKRPLRLTLLLAK